MAPDASELWGELKELRHEVAADRKEFVEFRLAVFRDYNALLKEVADRDLSDAKANSLWEVAKRWVPVLSVIMLLSSIAGGVVALFVFYLRHQP